MYSLPEISMVGGSSKDIQFNLFYDKENPKPYDITGSTANFSIMNIIDMGVTPLVSKNMSVTTSGGVKHSLCVSLTPEDTLNLFGKFIYQITIIDTDSNVIIPRQGIINIHNCINRDYIRRRPS